MFGESLSINYRYESYSISTYMIYIYHNMLLCYSIIWNPSTYIYVLGFEDRLDWMQRGGHASDIIMQLESSGR